MKRFSSKRKLCFPDGVMTKFRVGYGEYFFQARDTGSSIVSRKTGIGLVDELHDLT